MQGQREPFQVRRLASALRGASDIAEDVEGDSVNGGRAASLVEALRIPLITARSESPDVRGSPPQNLRTQAVVEIVG
jgi:hypothetical protein